MADSNTDRFQTYLLLGEIYRGRTNPDDIESNAEVSALFKGDFSTQSEDDRAADHEALFGMNVLPYASVFLEPNAMLGGDVTSEVNHFRELGGLRATGSDPSDHIASELELLGHLARSSVTEDASLLCDFVDRHVLSWLPSFAHAVRTESHPFYSHVADLTVAEVVAQRLALERESKVEAHELVTAPLLLEDSDTGLDDIARFLTTPVWCGFYLSRASISRLSRGGRLPHGFGGRSQMMATLLRSAAAYDGLAQLTATVQSEIDRWRGAWDATRDTGLEAACLWADQWTARLDSTERMLNDLLDAATNME